MLRTSRGPINQCNDLTKLTCPTNSDRRLKENIVRVGTHPLGIGLYLFNYKLAYHQTCGRGRHFGVMADEVERVLPEAVCLRSDGYKMVDYAMLGVTQADAW